MACKNPTDIIQPMDRFLSAGSAAKNSPWWGKRMLLAIIAAGIVFRIIQWGWGQPFWTDEASLLLNIATKTARQLMGPLDFKQACPPVHLLLLRWCYVTFGDSEYSLRIVPLVLSVITLPLFAALAWRLCPPVEAVLITAIFAFSDNILWHATEAKQYTTDLFSAVLLLWISVAARRPRSATGRLTIAAVVAALLIWTSHAAAFVFGAISLAMAPAVFRQPRGAIRWLLPNIFFGISMVILYRLSLQMQRTAWMTNTWRDQFVPWREPFSIPVWFIRGTIGLFDYPVQGFGAGILILSLAGAFELFRQRRLQMLAMMVLPMVLLLIASGLWLFPFSGNRVTFFTAPMILLTAGYGASLIFSHCKSKARYIGRGLLCVVVIETFGFALFHAWKPDPRTHILPAVAYLKTNYQKDEGIYVIGKGTGSMFMWYWRKEPGNSVIYKPEFGDNVPLPWQRFWVVGIFQPKHGIGEMQKDIDYASHGAVEIKRYQGNGSAAILFEKPR
jgi:hypothetical protein